MGSGPRPGWALSTQAFPPLGSQPAEIHGQDSRKLSILAKSVLGGRGPIVHSSADDDKGAPLVIRASKQQRAVVEECCNPVDFVTSSSADSVAVPVPIEHSGVRGTADTPSTGLPMKHSETSEDGRMVDRTMWVTVIHPGTLGRVTSGSHRRMKMQL